MSICYFNNNYENQYRCEYTIDADKISVEVEYDIGQELESKAGVRCWPASTEFTNRDILIVDSDNKNYFLLKEAYYSGICNKYGTLDARDITTFCSTSYFKSSNVSSLIDLLPTPKAKKIRVYNKEIAKYLQHRSVDIKRTNSKYSINMSHDVTRDCISIGHDNIKNLYIADDWSCNNRVVSISIELSGYIEIELRRRINYDQVRDYVYELMIFMQLFHPGKLKVEKICVEINNCFYEYHAALREPKYTSKHVNHTVKIGLLEFLGKCYQKIPYRKSKDEIRNIPYVVMNTSRNIEDNFLMFYKFIECYYKRQHKPKKYIMNSLKQHCGETKNCSDEQLEKLAQEIISLRNHYVHSGYYFKNQSLKIRFDSKKKDSRDYTARIDFDWIYERTKKLYITVIDIIFVNMLEIQEYVYDKRI